MYRTSHWFHSFYKYNKIILPVTFINLTYFLRRNNIGVGDPCDGLSFWQAKCGGEIGGMVERVPFTRVLRILKCDITAYETHEGLKTRTVLKLF